MNDAQIFFQDNLNSLWKYCQWNDRWQDNHFPIRRWHHGIPNLYLGLSCPFPHRHRCCLGTHSPACQWYLVRVYFLGKCQIHKIIILQIIQFKTPIYIKFCLSCFLGLEHKYTFVYSEELCFLHTFDAFLPLCPLLCCLISLLFPLIFSFYEIFLHVSLSKGAEPHSIHSKDFTLQASAQQLDNDADLPALSDELPEAWVRGWNTYLVLLYLLVSLWCWIVSLII